MAVRNREEIQFCQFRVECDELCLRPFVFRQTFVNRLKRDLTIAMRTRCEIKNGSVRIESVSRNASFTSASAFSAWPFCSSAMARNCKVWLHLFNAARCGSKIAAGISLS